jgi:hypothetical protein
MTYRGRRGSRKHPDEIPGNLHTGARPSRWPAVGSPLAVVLLLCLLTAPIAQAGWLPPVDLSEAGEHTGAPQVVLDAKGNATAVWETWNGEDTVVESAYRPAGQSWQSPVDISEQEGAPFAGGHDAQYPHIAVDADGDITVVWERSTGSGETVIQAAYHPAGGSWQSPVNISEAGVTESADEPWIAVDSRGDATAVWKRYGTIQSAYRPADGSWQVPVDVSESGTEALTPKAAVDAEGDATAVWMIHEAHNLVARTAYRPAGESWRAPTRLSAEGEEGADPQIALDAHGDALAVWGRSVGYDTIVRGSYRPAGGDWQEPTDISSEAEDAQSMELALDAQGDAVVAWAGSTNTVGGYDRAEAAYRPAGGDWGKSADLSEDGGNAFPTDVAFDQMGNAVVVWERSNGADNIVQAAYRPSGGDWQEPTSLSEEGRKSFDPVVVLDAEGEASAAHGDATVVWTSGQGRGCGEDPECSEPTTYTVQAAGYDAVEHPETIEVPIVGEVGAPVAFAATSDDVWSPLLSFGDGTSAASADTTHTYSEPGEYVVTFSSTEVLGYRASTQRSIRIEPKDPNKVATTKTGKTDAGVTETGASVSPRSLPLDFKFELVRQTLRAVLRAGAIRGVCYLGAPGVCTVHGAGATGRASFRSAGRETVTIRLTHRALKALRRAHRLKIVLTASASTTDHRSATTTSTLLLR